MRMTILRVLRNRKNLKFKIRSCHLKEKREIVGEMTTYKLRTPISEAEIRKLKVNDVLYITGVVVTARDQAHKRALEYAALGKPLPISLEGLALYHCGPVMSKKGGRWVAVAAGPTTSTRLELFEAAFIEKFKVRVIVGKGGMGEKTAGAMAKYGAVYCAFTGGAAALAAKAIKRVESVGWLDLGVPEAMWVFEVDAFGPLLVAIDSRGNNLFRDVAEKAAANRQRIYRKLQL
jgi:fumarate hydratase subunit beta